MRHRILAFPMIAVSVLSMGAMSAAEVERKITTLDRRLNALLTSVNDTTPPVDLRTGTTLAGSAIGGGSFQPIDSDLTSIAALTTTAFGRGLLDDADAAAVRATIGAVIGTDIQAFDADLSDLADGSLTGSKVGTGIAAGNITSGTVPDAQVDGASESDEVTGLTDAQISDTLTASTSTTAAANDSDTSIATTAFVQQEIDDGDLLSDNCILENDSTPIPDSCVGDGSDSGGGGSGNSVEVELDFATGAEIASVVVTGQTWVGVGSEIACTPTMMATADRAEAAEDAVIEGLVVAAHSRVAGTGFTLTGAPRFGNAYGKFKVHCIGV